MVVRSDVVVGEELVDFSVDVSVVSMVTTVVVKDTDVEYIVKIDVKTFCVVSFVSAKSVVMVCSVVVNSVDCSVTFGNNVTSVGGEDPV